MNRGLADPQPAAPPRRLHIALVNTLYFPDEIGGAERSVKVLAEGLTRAGHKVTVIRAGEADRRYEAEGIDVVQRAVRNLYWPFDGQRHETAVRLAWHGVDAYNLAQPAGLAAILRELHLDVVHTNNLFGLSVAAWTAAARAKVPLVHTTRDYYLLCQRSTMRKATGSCATQCARCRLFTVARRRLSTSVNAVVGISQHILDTHLRAGYFAGSRHAVIHNAVTGRESASAPAPAGSGDGQRLVVGYLGRLEEEKGVELLIRAWQAMPAQHAHRLRIAGSGAPDYERHLKVLAADSPIEFVGTVDAGTFLRGVALLVVPSLWAEPMGRVVIEAYLAGKPVVVCNRGGLPELVDEDRTGWIVEPTIDALSARLHQALAVPAQLQAMAAKVLDKSDEFSAARMVDRYEVIYRSVSTN